MQTITPIQRIRLHNTTFTHTDFIGLQQRSHLTPIYTFTQHVSGLHMIQTFIYVLGMRAYVCSRHCKHRLFSYVFTHPMERDMHATVHNISQYTHRNQTHVPGNRKRTSSSNKTRVAPRTPGKSTSQQNVTKVVVIFPYQNRRIHYAKQMHNL